jgi:hypothetical protein
VAAAISAADRSLSLVIRFLRLDMKSQKRLAPLWKWSGDRPIKVTIPHLASTRREIGASRQFGSLNRFLIENVSVGEHCQSDFPVVVRLPEVLLG